MEQEQMEMELWGYIDGTCEQADTHRIANLIATRADWKNKYEELRAFNAALAEHMETEQPSMRFSKDVMDAISKTQIAPATDKYINPFIIRSIATFFIATIAVAIGYLLLSVKWDSPSTNALNVPTMHMERLFNATTLNVTIALTVVLGLVLLDGILRRNNKAHA